MPSDYTVTFVPGGSVAVKADCKTAGGTYTADDTRLIFDLKVISTDACAEGSMADAFIEQMCIRDRPKVAPVGSPSGALMGCLLYTSRCV